MIGLPTYARQKKLQESYTANKNNENQKQSSLRLKMILVTSANYFFRSIGDGTFLKYLSLSQTILPSMYSSSAI